jgi:hypothetical protein
LGHWQILGTVTHRLLDFHICPATYYFLPKPKRSKAHKPLDV